ncbi:uncharacterized protein LOC111291978 isoform X2 [Durio zibethinus]|uniref:Calmodulin-lysine N-methyltransferase n=1 Tax=Durio zibethinus TaxID=66656 RepID=A0A6P5YHG1_DURZI|nr:uncharacterized protein LOC111291978 isoform X2 [Durio zibethinus]
METDNNSSNSKTSASSLRWGILRRAVLNLAKNPEDESQLAMNIISRKATKGFNLIPCQLLHHDHESRDARLCYTLPIQGSPKLVLTQRVDNSASLSDFEVSGHLKMSLPIFAYHMATCSDIQHNINTNSGAFGETSVKSMKLHWHQKEISNLSHTFDVIVASDCTFFKEFHKDLARITQLLLKNVGPSEAIFFSPRRGNSLDKFLEEIEDNGLLFSITESYDAEIWKCHQRFMNGDDSWPGYEKDHCYPLLIRITR